MTKRRYRIPSRQQVRVLQALLRCRDQGSHGYDLKATALSPATLYGLLKRLHDEGYLSKLEQTVDGRCRLCYTLTRVGLHYAERILLEDEYERGAAQLASLERS
ncbi:hypothetical protein BH24DEI2_BH24DEI2_09870 [soil metagenome]